MMRNAARPDMARMRSTRRRPASGVSITTSSSTAAMSGSCAISCSACCAERAGISCRARPSISLSCRFSAVAVKTSGSSSTTSTRQAGGPAGTDTAPPSPSSTSSSSSSDGGLRGSGLAMLGGINHLLAALLGRRGGGARQLEYEPAAVARLAAQRDAPAQDAHDDIAHDGQAQATAAAAQARGEEGLEGARLHRLAHAAAVVADYQLQRVAGRPLQRHADLAGPVLQAVHCGIDQQVVERLAQGAGIAVQRHVGRHLVDQL
eukprot:Opistho-2@70027